jgi:hypothetical protein
MKLTHVSEGLTTSIRAYDGGTNDGSSKHLRNVYQFMRLHGAVSQKTLGLLRTR